MGAARPSDTSACFQGFVNRSVSDVSEIRAEEERTKLTREKRQKIYKSDPLGKAKAKRRPVHSNKGVEHRNIIEERQMSVYVLLFSNSPFNLYLYEHIDIFWKICILYHDLIF